MPEYDHDAIRKAYPSAVSIDDDLENGVLDANGNPLSIDQSLVDAARAELDKLSYQYDRKAAYPSLREQLDYIYHNGIDKCKTDIVDPVKAKYPKPS